jgi:hypothetical protein
MHFDIYFDNFNLNLRQIDFINLMKCSDLNILYTDNLEYEFNYENLKNLLNENYKNEKENEKKK